MPIQTLLLGGLALAPAAINAAPTTAKAIDCINLRIHGWYLVGECLTGQDATTRIESSVFLNNIVTTNKDILQVRLVPMKWKRNAKLLNYDSGGRVARVGTASAAARTARSTATLL
jgi:hypothetical protein